MTSDEWPGLLAWVGNGFWLLVLAAIMECIAVVVVVAKIIFGDPQVWTQTNQQTGMKVNGVFSWLGWLSLPSLALSFLVLAWRPVVWVVDHWWLWAALGALTLSLRLWWRPLTAWVRGERAPRRPRTPADTQPLPPLPHDPMPRGPAVHPARQVAQPAAQYQPIPTAPQSTIPAVADDTWLKPEGEYFSRPTG